jgi:hypothetical protein
MATVTRLAGAVRRVITLRSDQLGKLVTITLAEGEELPEGVLVAEATAGEDTLTLTATEVGGSGPVVVELELLPEDFDYYGDRNWDLVVAIDDSGSGSDPEETRAILFDGVVRFLDIAPRVIETTTITTITGSGS